MNAEIPENLAIKVFSTTRKIPIDCASLHHDGQRYILKRKTEEQGNIFSTLLIIGRLQCILVTIQTFTTSHVAGAQLW